MCVKIPRKIWGGGGGVAFLCQQRYMQNSRAFTQKYFFYQISCMVIILNCVFFLILELIVVFVLVKFFKPQILFSAKLIRPCLQLLT